MVNGSWKPNSAMNGPPSSNLQARPSTQLRLQFLHGNHGVLYKFPDGIALAFGSEPISSSLMWSTSFCLRAPTSGNRRGCNRFGSAVPPNLEPIRYVVQF